MIVTARKDVKTKIVLLFLMDVFLFILISYIGHNFLYSFVCFFLFLIYILYFWFVFGKSIYLDQNGCTVNFLFYKKTYCWNELKVKHIENHSMIFGFDIPSELTCAIFSKKKYFKPKFISPSTYCEFHPFNFSFIYLNLIPRNYDAENLPTNYSAYPIDEQLFYSKMKEWNIEFEK